MPSLLSDVVRKLGRPMWSFVDSGGTFAFRYPDKIVVAKSYIYGNIVSCHARLIGDAKKSGVPLVMFIDSADKFYRFEPDEIKTHPRTWYNERNGVKMCNFIVNIGSRWEE